MRCVTVFNNYDEFFPIHLRMNVTLMSNHKSHGSKFVTCPVKHLALCVCVDAPGSDL